VGNEAAETIDATVVLVGQGVLADALARRLPRVGLELERANAAQAAQHARVIAPDLLVLVGDAAGDGGKRVLAQLATDTSVAELPVLVICGPSLATLGGIGLRKTVAALAPEGGIDVCALRIQQLIEALAGQGLGGQTLQQKVDAVAAKPKAGAAGAPSNEPAPKSAATGSERKGRSPTLVGIPSPLATERAEPVPSERRSTAGAARAPSPRGPEDAPTTAAASRAVTAQSAGATPHSVSPPVATPAAAPAEPPARAPAAAPAPAPIAAPAPAPTSARTATLIAAPAVGTPAARQPTAAKPPATAPSAPAATPVAAATPAPAAALAPEPLAAPAPRAAHAPAPMPVAAATAAPIELARTLAPVAAAAPTPVAAAAPPLVAARAAEPVLAHASTMLALPSAAPAVEVDWSEEPTRDGQTPLAWTTEAESAAPAARAATFAARLRARGRWIVAAGAAALLAAAATAIVALRSATDEDRVGAATGAIAPTPRGAMPVAVASARTADPTTTKSAAEFAASTATKASGATAKQPTGSARDARTSAPSAKLSAAHQDDARDPGALRDDEDDEDDDDSSDAPSRVRPELRHKVALANRNVTQGHRLLRRGQLGLAEAAYLKALSALPNYPRAMAGLARVHLRRKDGAEAVRWAERLVKQQPKRGNNQLLLGDAWALRGQPARARAAWLRAAAYGNAAARSRLK
jgi:hypothetical protein